MNKQEFEELTGWNIVDAEYRAFEEIYMACEGLDKFAYCKDIVKHNGSLILASLFIKVQQLEEQVKMLQDERKETTSWIVTEANKMSSPTARAKAIELMGKEGYIEEVITRGYGLWKSDLSDILTIIKNKK